MQVKMDRFGFIMIEPGREYKPTLLDPGIVELLTSGNLRSEYSTLDRIIPKTPMQVTQYFPYR